MLPKKHRLSKSAEVRQTTARGRSFFNPYFILKVVPTAELPKITMIASVKMSKKAIERNRAKRIFRDEFRKHIAKLKPGNYALIIRKSAVKATPTELRQALNSSLVSSKALS